MLTFAMVEPRKGRRDASSVRSTGSSADDGRGSVNIDGAGMSRRVTCELPIDGADGWYVSALFLQEGEQLVMAELKVFPGPGGRTDGRRAARRKPGEWSGQPDALADVPDGDGRPSGPARVGRPGSAGRPDRQYAEWAFRYAKKLAEGSRSPIKDLAAEHGRSPGQVRDLIHDARVRGLLSKERQGRAAGSLTPKAIQLLRGEG
jgi:hypothetical protein